VSLKHQITLQAGVSGHPGLVAFAGQERDRVNFERIAINWTYNSDRGQVKSGAKVAGPNGRERHYTGVTSELVVELPLRELERCY
jgi:hypothetical protein